MTRGHACATQKVLFTIVLRQHERNITSSGETWLWHDVFSRADTEQKHYFQLWNAMFPISTKETISDYPEYKKYYKQNPQD